MKAPDTAEFSHRNDTYTVEDGKTVTYYGTVTAQNSFGVPLRCSYVVVYVVWGLDFDEYQIVSADLIDD